MEYKIHVEQDNRRRIIIDNADTIIRERCEAAARGKYGKPMQKLQCRRLYSLSKKAPTEEEREAAKQEYLELVGKVRANAILG
ncbi:MAG: hypothetical protein ACSW8G_02410 [Bacillota bacterium]